MGQRGHHARRMGAMRMAQQHAKHVPQAVHLFRRTGYPRPYRYCPYRSLPGMRKNFSITPERASPFPSHSRAFPSIPSSRNIRASIFRAAACRIMVERLEESPMSAEVIQAG